MASQGVSVNFDTSQLAALVARMEAVPSMAFKAITEVVDVSGEALLQGWKANATATSGVHGKHYPDAITKSIKPGLATVGVEVGPESGRPQGGMSFEHGSVNQPPHMDGNRAADVVEPMFNAALPVAIVGLLSRAL